MDVLGLFRDKQHHAQSYIDNCICLGYHQEGIASYAASVVGCHAWTANLGES